MNFALSIFDKKFHAYFVIKGELSLIMLQGQ